MTLIITELCNFGFYRGIVMAADTAQTEGSMNVRGLVEDRAFFGLNKLLQVRKLQAGISYWGWAKMPPSSDNGIWMDWWLNRFLVKNRNNFNSLSELAKLLENELRNLVPRLSDKELELTDGLGSGGIHLSGFTNEGQTKNPSFWHIHNGVSQVLPEKKIDPHIVNANYDCPPQKYLNYERQGASISQTTNGDFEPYARFFRKYLSKYLEELNKEMDIVIPIPNIEFEANFLRTQIKFISGLYAVGGYRKEGTIQQLPRGISDIVTTLTITEDGIQNYQTI